MNHDPELFVELVEHQESDDGEGDGKGGEVDRVVIIVDWQRHVGEAGRVREALRGQS